MPVSMVSFRVTVALLLAALLAGCEQAPADALPASAPAMASQAAEETLPSPEPDAGDIVPVAASTSDEVVDGAIGEPEPIRSLLFADSGVLEESIETRALTPRTSVVLAIGRADIATFVVYVLQPAAQQADPRSSRYRVASRVVSQPAGAVDGSVQVADWRIDDAGRAHLVLDLRHDVVPAGDHAGGEPTAARHERRVAFVFDPVSGLLESTDG